MNQFYRYTDFRDVVRHLVDLRRAEDRRFNFSVLAKALGIQKPYLSRVLNDGGFLSTDQLFLLTEYFSLSKEESEYLTLLIEHERSGHARRKKILHANIAAIQLAHRSPKKVMAADFLEAGASGEAADYYLDPYMTIAHMYLMLPEFASNPENLSGALGISPAYTRRILATLKRLGIIVPVGSGKTARVVKDYLQLSPESPLNSAYYALFRLASSQQLMKIARDQRCIYSMTFAADERTKNMIHEGFLKLLREIEKPIRDAPSEEIFQMNFDLFPWR